MRHVTALLVVLALVVGGCADDGDEAMEPSATTAQTESGEDTAEDAPWCLGFPLPDDVEAIEATLAAMPEEFAGAQREVATGPERIETFYERLPGGLPSIQAASIDAMEAAAPGPTELSGFEAMDMMLQARLEPAEPGGMTGAMDESSMDPAAGLVWATGDAIEVGDTREEDVRAPSIMFATPGGRWIYTIVASTPDLRTELVEAFCDAARTGLLPLEQRPDASGAAAAGDAPPPDLDGAVAGDDGAEPLALGAVAAPNSPDRLDFLFERCARDWCYRDAVFVNPDDPELVTAAWQAGRPFHVRHGFVNDGPEPLGPGFDVVLYITPGDTFRPSPGPFPDETVRYTSDFVLRGESDQCGPTYRTQTEPVTCEWFVHEFDEGLPEGRYTLWAYWEAPCEAWIDDGFITACTDPDEVLALFTSGVNSPWETNEVAWDQR